MKIYPKAYIDIKFNKSTNKNKECCNTKKVDTIIFSKEAISMNDNLHSNDNLEKIKSIKESVISGTYKIDSKKVAKKILERMEAV